MSAQAETSLSQTSLPYVPAFYACFTGALYLCLSSRQDKGRGLSETQITDQGLGLRRATFDALGRFPEQPFLEDLHLVLEARRRGRVVTLAPAVRSSARRWEQNGVIGNTFRNQCVLLGYMVGVPIPRIAEWYYGKQGKKKY